RYFDDYDGLLQAARTIKGGYGVLQRAPANASVRAFQSETIEQLRETISDRLGALRNPLPVFSEPPSKVQPLALVKEIEVHTPLSPPAAETAAQLITETKEVPPDVRTRI